MNLVTPPFRLSSVSPSQATQFGGGNKRRSTLGYVAILLMLLISACGQRGDLVLPQEDSDPNANEQTVN